MAGFLPHIPFYCIHLEREEGRLDLIKSFEEGLGRPLVLWNASEGADVAKFSWPRRHPWEGETKEGELGCLASHVRLLGLMHTNVIGVFEDDAELVCSVEVLQKYMVTVEEIMPDWDIIFLGANEWVESLPFARIAMKPHFDDIRRLGNTCLFNKASRRRISCNNASCCYESRVYVSSRLALCENH